MNKIISVYELLGLIKDGKVPKSIIYKNEYFKYSKENRGYIGENNYLFSDFADLISILNEKVEILEEDKHIIEKIKKHEFEENGITISEQPSIIEIADKLNEVIDYINKGEKNDNRV